MTRAGRNLVAVLASAWFFPASCTIVMVPVTSILAGRDARDAARGDTVHTSIAVVAIPSPGKPAEHLLLGNVARYKEQHPDASFLVPDREGRIEPDANTRVSYKMLDGTAAVQTIETQYRDGDRSAWGRYRATQREVTPLASRLTYQDYMLGTTPYALGFALLVYVIAGFARRRMRAADRRTPDPPPS